MEVCLVQQWKVELNGSSINRNIVINGAVHLIFLMWNMEWWSLQCILFQMVVSKFQSIAKQWMMVDISRFLVGSSVFNWASGFTTYVHVLEILIEFSHMALFCSTERPSPTIYIGDFFRWANGIPHTCLVLANGNLDIRLKYPWVKYPSYLRRCMANLTSEAQARIVLRWGEHTNKYAKTMVYFHDICS